MTGAERYLLRPASRGVRRFVSRHRGRSSERVRPGWTEELANVKSVLASLAFGSFLDVACGTGFFTASLRGNVIGLDQSASMLAVARSSSAARDVRSRRCTRTSIPVGSQFDCFDQSATFTGIWTCPLAAHSLAEARRVSKSMLIFDAAKREDVPAGRISAARAQRRIAPRGLQTLLHAGSA